MRSFHFPGRSPVYGRRAMCATSHPAASLTAIEIARQGGNAVDAAIATAAVLAVVEPHMTGIGGDCFALLAKPGARSRSRSTPPGARRKAATADWYAKSGHRRASSHAAPRRDRARRHRRLDAGCSRTTAPCRSASLLQPAIALAESGFVVAPRVAADWARNAAKLTGMPAPGSTCSKDGRAPKAGEVMRFPALAAHPEAIAQEGRDGFYAGRGRQGHGGRAARRWAACTRSTISRPRPKRQLRHADLGGLSRRGAGASCRPATRASSPSSCSRCWSVSASRAAEPVSAERYHLLMEAARLAYAMRDAFVADPDMADVPVDAHAGRRGDRQPRRPHRPHAGASPSWARCRSPSGSDTVYFSVVDEKGMAVSFINSLFDEFGSGIVTAKTGIVLHNRGKGFVTDPKHPNCIAPGKRPLHTLVPAMVLKDGKPYMAFGVMGAHFQPMGHVYIMSNMFDYGMDPQEAIDSPRVFFEGDALLVEESVPAEVVAGLRRLGHRVARGATPWGGGQIVVMDRDRGVLIGASDPRKDGMAIGY